MTAHAKSGAAGEKKASKMPPFDTPTVRRPGRPFRRFLIPFREFAHTEAASGILLLGCAVVALAWANSPWAAAYVRLWATEVTIGGGRFALTETLHHWINDGLMAIFFFVVGLEIKREVLVGELASARQAALPIAAAIGGMIAPALLFTVLNAGTPGAVGWGVPMATDIAFALGLLALLGDRVPVALKVFLTALAIVDDLGAVLVIAFFYTADLAWTSLGAAGLILLALVAANRLHVRRPVVYALLGVALWVAVLKSGVHATLAGVLLAFTIPARIRIDPEAFLERGRAYLDDFAQASAPGSTPLTNATQLSALQGLESACEEGATPLQRLEHTLHPWVAYGIIPIFALANAGVTIAGDLGSALTNRVTLGVIVGLVVGKQIGITLCAWLATRAGLAALPTGVTWRQIYGVSWLAGVGFTMALFIGELAFATPELLAAAKLGILAASLVAAAGGWLLLRGIGPAAPAALMESPGDVQSNAGTDASAVAR